MAALKQPDTLVAAVERYGLEFSDQQLAQIDQYRQSLWNWNERVNLTRHTDFGRFVARDVVDSMQLANLLSPGESVLDVGSGGGVPGVIVALLRPDVEVVLAESVGKKVVALAAMVHQLGLKIGVHAGRGEALLAEQDFSTVIARAVGPLAKLLPLFQPYWHHFQRMLLVKGPRWVEERGTARHLGLLRSIDLRRIASYRSPDNLAENVVLELRRKFDRDGQKAT